MLHSQKIDFCPSFPLIIKTMGLSTNDVTHYKKNSSQDRFRAFLKIAGGFG
jgi:hypothetical protein